MVNHLFGFDPALKSDKSQNYAAYLKKFKKKCDEIRKINPKL